MFPDNYHVLDSINLRSFSFARLAGSKTANRKRIGRTEEAHSYLKRISACKCQQEQNSALVGRPGAIEQSDAQAR